MGTEPGSSGEVAIALSHRAPEPSLQLHSYSSFVRMGLEFRPFYFSLLSTIVGGCFEFKMRHIQTGVCSLSIQLGMCNMEKRGGWFSQISIFLRKNGEARGARTLEPVVQRNAY